MKKTVAIVVVLLILLLLTACQVVPNGETDQVGSNPSSGSSTPPSSSVAPTTQPTVPPASSTPPTSEPATSVPATSEPDTSTPPTNPLELDETGYTFIYNGSAPFFSIDPDCSECTVGHLYWVDKTTEEVTPILEEQVLESIKEGAYVYYVKADDPMKIYRTPIGEFAQHEIIYESTHGKVSEMLIDTYVIREQLVLQFVADEKKFVVLDLTTGEDHVVMEQYYIRHAYFEDTCSDNWTEQNKILFSGQIEAGAPVRLYMYYLDTGELREEGEHAD